MAILKKQVKEYNKEFRRDLIIGLALIIILTICFGNLDWISRNMQTKITKNVFEIIVTIIGYLGILVGFFLTALGVIIS